MAKRLVDWPGGVTVFDVRTEATPLAEAGAALADSVADVGTADIISITVLNDEQVRTVVDELAAHAKPGTVIAIHSTISPTPARVGQQLEPGASTSSTPRQRRGVAEKGELPPWWAPTARCSSERIKPAFAVGVTGDPRRRTGAGTRMKWPATC